MGEKFVGSFDHVLIPIETGIGSSGHTGAWFQLTDAENFEFEVISTNFSGADATVTLETDLGPTQHEVENIIVDDNSTKTTVVSLGGQPGGGGRVRAVVVKADDDVDLIVTIKETRSGLG